MECVEDRADNQVLGPDHTSRPNEHSPAKASQAEPRHLGSHDQDHAKPIRQAPLIIHLRDNNSVDSIGCTRRDVGHHEHTSVLFDVPWTWIEGELKPAEPSGEPVGCHWKDEGKQLAKGMGSEGHYAGGYYRSWLSEIEEHICRSKWQSMTGVWWLVKGIKRWLLELGAHSRRALNTHAVINTSSIPINHIRIVRHGISGSSIFDTEARTSGNGLSSSSIASKSNSILADSQRKPRRGTGN